jgi:hypothetical protein
MTRRLVLGLLVMMVFGSVPGCQKSEEPVPVDREFKSRLPRAPRGGASPTAPAKKQPTKTP